MKILEWLNNIFFKKQQKGNVDTNDAIEYDTNLGELYIIAFNMLRDNKLTEEGKNCLGEIEGGTISTHEIATSNVDEETEGLTERQLILYKKRKKKLLNPFESNHPDECRRVGDSESKRNA